MVLVFETVLSYDTGLYVELSRHVLVKLRFLSLNLTLIRSYDTFQNMERHQHGSPAVKIGPIRYRSNPDISFPWARR